MIYVDINSPSSKPIMYTKYSNLFIITILEANELSKVAIIIIINLSTSNFTNASTISIKNYWKV